MGFLVAAAFIVVGLMALGGSPGARKFLGAIAVLAVILAAVIGGYAYVNHQEDARREAARASREAACRSTVTSECLYRELRDAKTRITSAIDAFRTTHSDTDPTATKAIADGLLNTTGYITVSRDNARRLLVYTLRPNCPGEKKFYFQVEFSLSPNENGLTRVDTWWQDGERENDLFRDWHSCVTVPDAIAYASNHDNALSIDYSRTVPASWRNAANDRRTTPRGGLQAKTLSEDGDPCAVNISADERLKRLRRYGPVRQTGLGTYSAGSHRLVLSGTTLISCY